MRDEEQAVTAHLQVEVQRADGTWGIVGHPLRDGDPPGSTSDNSGPQRQVYIFGVEGDHAAIRRSVGGVDAADPRVRVLTTDGLELVHSLALGESYELPVVPDPGYQLRLLRFTFREGRS